MIVVNRPYRKLRFAPDVVQPCKLREGDFTLVDCSCGPLAPEGSMRLQVLSGARSNPHEFVQFQRRHAPVEEAELA